MCCFVHGALISENILSVFALLTGISISFADQNYVLKAIVQHQIGKYRHLLVFKKYGWQDRHSKYRYVLLNTDIW
mgnify:CR=1 FL=1